MAPSSRIRIPSRVTAGLLALFASLALAAPAAPDQFHGALTQQVNLYDLATRADSIVHAHVVSARVEPHPDYPGLSTVLVTLRVESTFKGPTAPGEDNPALMTFRQFIWDSRDRANGGGYRKGQELLLFLTRESAIGLSAPVGLDQGRLPIVREAGSGATGRGPGLEPHATTGPAVSGDRADRLLRDFAPALARQGITLSAQDQPILARAQGRPLSLTEIAALIGAIDRSLPLAPATVTPEGP